jgi:hypothetical protein
VQGSERVVRVIRSFRVPHHTSTEGISVQMSGHVLRVRLQKTAP